MSKTKAVAKRTAPWTADELALIERELVAWLRVGMSTDPVDIAAVQSAWHALYRRAKRDPVFVWVVPGPLAAHAALAIWEKHKIGDSLDGSLCASLDGSLRDSLCASLGASLRDSLRGSLGDSLYDSLYGSLGASLRDSLRDSLDGSLDGSLCASLDDSLRDSLYGSLCASLDGSLCDSLCASLGASLRDSLYDSLCASLGDKPLTYRQTWFWGGHEAYWTAWYRVADTLVPMFNDEQRARLAEYENYVRNGLWAWPHENGVVVCDRPSVCAMEEATPGRWRLHHPTGPALAFRDGYSVYAWHGVRVPASVITENPDAWTLDAILKEGNAEVRRVRLERFGGERLRAHSTFRQRDDFGELREFRIPGEDRPYVFVDVENKTAEPDGSFKRYCLSVPPETESALAGVAWTFRQTPQEYVLSGES